MAESKLSELLDFDPRNEDNSHKVDGDAIIREVEKNPYSAEQKYLFLQNNNGTYMPTKCFPLHQAIALKLDINVINALSNDVALKDKYFFTRCIHLALECDSSLEVVMLLLEKKPEAARVKGSLGQTPLHWACKYRAPVEVVSLLLSRWPESIKQKSSGGLTPLHQACIVGAPVEVLSLLLKSWPDAIKEKDNYGHTFFHYARMCRAPMNVILLILDKWLEDKENRYGHKVESLKYNASENVKKLLSYVSSLFNDEANNPCPNEILSFFIGIKWWKGVLLLINRYPNMTKSFDLQTNAMADYLSVVGQRCNLTTLWEVIENEQDLLGDV
mmetsp:Transcript_15964/g.20198  ORF Transcript_15964/g.20198 Transcript_15964/m.20198 type:complete len:329 (+) Transcript_15964:180-1166(+)